MTTEEQAPVPTIDTPPAPEKKKKPRKPLNIGPAALRVCAELVGSFLVCLSLYLIGTVGCSMYGVNLAFIAVATGLVYATVTMALGSVCSAQFNPAVTVAAMLTSKMGVLEGILNIIVQVAGAIGAAAVVTNLLPTSDSITASVWLTPVVNGFDSGSVSYTTLYSAGLSSFGIALAIVVEVAACLLIVATAMRTSKEHGKTSMTYVAAMAVAYGLGAAIAYPVTGAALNPARATGIAIFAQGQGLTQEPLEQLWIFWVCPVLAAALVALPMVIAQMVADSQEVKRKKAAIAAGKSGDTDADDAGAAEFMDSEKAENVEVGNDQADTEADTNKGVESH